MVPKILRALKAAFLRRKPTTSPNCPAASFHAEPQYTPLGSSVTRNLMLASISDAMLATSHLAEIVALFPGDDDSCYEESVLSVYGTGISSDADSTTCEESFEEEGIFVNGM